MPIASPLNSADPFHKKKKTATAELDSRDFSRDAQNSLRSSWFFPYQPINLLRSGHAQTLAGNFWRRSEDASSPITPKAVVEAIPVEVDPADGSRVLCQCLWQPEPVRAGRMTILLVHGLEGSSESRYMQGISQLAWNAGCNVIRMNMRNCGGTEQWTPTLYHSGLSSDIWAVLQHFVEIHGLRRVGMAGYSMGGNLVLKLAGELGSEAPDWLMGAVGVSPATDLAPSADALHEPANRFYEWHFLRNLMRRFRRKVELYPQRYSLSEIGPVRTIREFDQQITARYSGFRDADDYYYRASSARVVSKIAIPTLVLHALDDPFIRMMPETRQTLLNHPKIELIETAQGGHCAFLARKGIPSAVAPDDPVAIGRESRHWAEAILVRFLMATVGHEPESLSHGS
jgi:predicted alpha/beta-fold hydrolase